MYEARQSIATYNRVIDGTHHKKVKQLMVIHNRNKYNHIFTLNKDGKNNSVKNGLLQRMIVVPGLSSIIYNDSDNNRDAFLLSHIHWAKNKSKGNIVDINNMGVVNDNETIHFVQHGGVGSINHTNVDEIANKLNALPGSFKGKIIFTSCYSGTKDANGTSLIESVKKKLKRKDLTIEGYDGPTITNYTSKGDIFEVVDNNHVYGAFDIQSQLMSQYKAVFQEIKNYKAKDMEDLISFTSMKLHDFYELFTQKLRDRNILKDTNPINV